MEHPLTDEGKSPILASGIPQDEAEAGALELGAGVREHLSLAQRRRGGRALAAGAISFVLVGAALVAYGARDLAGRAALAAPESADTQLAEDVFAERQAQQNAQAKQDPPQIIMPDMGMGFPSGTFWPTLFCWSTMNVKNYNEVAILKMQLKHRIGIFGCDNVAVLSASRVKLGYGHAFNNGTKVPVFTWVNPAKDAPVGNLAAGDHTNSVKNTGIFINAWNILIKSGALWGHNWTAKVDPDAVFFAERLRWHVKKFTYGSAPFYFRNCDYKGPKLYGALEVFNEHALKLYKAKATQCQHLPWAGWGEDEWINKCMMAIGGQPQNDYTLVGDHRCMSAECDDTWRAAFHDYKTPAAYLSCYQRSLDAKRLKDTGAFCCVAAPDTNNKCGSCQGGNKIYPGKGFCGTSKSNCQKCGNQAGWCGK